MMSLSYLTLCVFFFNDTATTAIYTLSLHDALPISVFINQMAADNMFPSLVAPRFSSSGGAVSNGFSLYLTNSNAGATLYRSEEHTSELQSQSNLVCRLLLEKKKYT